MKMSVGSIQRAAYKMRDGGYNKKAIGFDLRRVIPRLEAGKKATALKERCL
jgi:hypothetical protein